jgi:hypothetical protein
MAMKTRQKNGDQQEKQALFSQELQLEAKTGKSFRLLIITNIQRNLRGQV